MLIVVIVFVILLLAGMPLAFTIGISSAIFFILNPYLPLSIVTQRMVAATQNFPLLAVPFFVLAGNLMNETGITKRLIRFATVLTGHLTGGLAHVSIVLSSLLGGISGSAVADAAMEARLLGPSMVERGYDKAYSSAVIGLSSLITATIPPGIGLILYGFVGQVSIGRLFIAGIIPGLLMAALLMVAAYFTSKKRGYLPVRDNPPTLKEVFSCLKESIWAILFPLILIVGIRFGIFTPSEAGAFAVVYAFIIGKFVYRELTWKNLKKVLHQTALDNGVIMLIISCSSIFGYVIVSNQVPQSMATVITGITNNPTLLLFLILGFLFVAGMVMEATVNVLLLTPIFLPIVRSVGIDPVHFGIMMMTIVTMGGMTPPVGVTMYTVCSLMEVPVEKYVRQSIPFIAAILVLIVILAFVPKLVLFLPDLVYSF